MNQDTTSGPYYYYALKPWRCESLVWVVYVFKLSTCLNSRIALVRAQVWREFPNNVKNNPKQEGQVHFKVKIFV